ncbi:MAG TPA: NADH-quinone oxidoreductase subunit NuoE, partial [Nitrospirota bacterium]
MKSKIPAGAKPSGKKKRSVSGELIDKVFEGFDPSAKDIILPVLRRTQEVFGYLDADAVFEVAARLKVSPAQLYGVATFYDQFLTTPAGRNIIRVCTNIACNINGAEALLEHLRAKLKVKNGGTTKDGRFTLFEVECIGSCGKGPAITINDDFHYNLTASKVDEI